jgi:hypothetical protein
MPDAPTIYANTLMALSLRRPGILQVTLGTAGFSGEDIEVALRLAVPEDTAVEIVEALVEGLQAAAEEDEDDEVRSPTRPRSATSRPRDSSPPRSPPPWATPSTCWRRAPTSSSA